jgi:NAD(P)-dependent dehydrogenase (short-subunit alcohol dehydrogenase family)
MPELTGSEFTGQVVLVTGASGGLGPAVVEAFLAAGATVAAVARSVQPRNDASRFLAISADLTTPAGARDAVNLTVEQAKGLDVLVHVMGGYAGGQPVHATDDGTWDRMIDLNLRAAFLATRAVLPYMLQAQYGRIVAVSSRTSIEPAANNAAYGVSKAGLNVLIQTIAKETLGQGITANAVLPSVIDTPANRKAMPKADHARWVTPEKIAQLILWLCSEAALEISGALVPIYGRG